MFEHYRTNNKLDSLHSYQKISPICTLSTRLTFLLPHHLWPLAAQPHWITKKCIPIATKIIIVAPVFTMHLPNLTWAHITNFCWTFYLSSCLSIPKRHRELQQTIFLPPYPFPCSPQLPFPFLCWSIATASISMLKQSILTPSAPAQVVYCSTRPRTSWLSPLLPPPTTTYFWFNFHQFNRWSDWCHCHPMPPHTTPSASSQPQQALFDPLDAFRPMALPCPSAPQQLVSVSSTPVDMQSWVSWLPGHG